MVRMVCRQCRYARDMTDREVEFGMICPNCHCQKLRPPLTSRPGRAETGLRPLTVRSLLAAAFFLLAGPVVFAVGYNNLNGPGGVLMARVFAFGVLLCVAGVISLISGLVGVCRDLTEE